MIEPRSVLLAAALFCAACDQGVVRTAEYAPEEAGTVDHALCLLGFTGVPLREIGTGHHLVDVEINGRTGAFVLDTGANASVLHTGYADEFGLQPGGAPTGQAVGIGGQQSAAMAPVDSIRIGGVDIRQNRMLVADVSQLPDVLARFADEPIHGIIGQDVLSEHRAVIDVGRPLLFLIEADQDPAPVPAESCRAPQGADERG